MVAANPRNEVAKLLIASGGTSRMRSRGARRDQRHAFVPACGHLHLEAGRPEQRLQVGAVRRLIVDHRDARGHDAVTLSS
jgi:hypothetical protein